MKIRNTIMISATYRYYAGKSGLLYDKKEIAKLMAEYMSRENKFGKLCSGDEQDEPGNFSISLTDISHKVTEIEVTDDHVSVEVEILGTPCGKIAQQLIDAGIRLYVTMNSVGRIDEMPHTRFNSMDRNCRLADISQVISFDLVGFPEEQQINNNGDDDTRGKEGICG